MISEVYLLISFAILLVVALGIALYPLRRHKKIVMLLVPLFTAVIGLSYWHWGAWTDWRTHVAETIQQQQVQALLQTIHGPDELVNQLKARLVDRPKSARGWYLLGRLYASQNKWQPANEAFATAHRLKPLDEQTTVNYVQSLWQLNHQAYNANTRSLLKTLIKNNPNQPDALAMLAMDAYISQDYQQAIDFWQRLLLLAPPQSEEAQAIRKAIAKAQQRIVL